MEIDAGNSNNKTCTICEKEYTRRYTYIRQMNTMHKDDKREPATGLAEKRKASIDNSVVPV